MAKEIKQEQTAEVLHSSAEVAAEVGLEQKRLLSLHDRRRLPEPTYRVAGKRIYTDDDIKKIREALNGAGGEA